MKTPLTVSDAKSDFEEERGHLVRPLQGNVPPPSTSASEEPRSDFAAALSPLTRRRRALPFEKRNQEHAETTRPKGFHPLGVGGGADDRRHAGHTDAGPGMPCPLLNHYMLRWTCYPIRKFVLVMLRSVLRYALSFIEPLYASLDLLSCACNA